MYNWREPTQDSKLLVRRMLCVDVMKRLNIEQIYRQTWITCNDQDLRSIDLSVKIAAFKKFNLRAKFRKVMRKSIKMLRDRSSRLVSLFVSLKATSPTSGRHTGGARMGREVSETLREKALSSLSDVGADIDDLQFSEKYSLMEDQELGSGAFATVYRGALLRNGRQVAIKLIDRTRLSEATEEVMKSEAEMLKSLNHRNVIRCFDFYQEPERFIIVMELVEGGDLLTRLARKTVYSEKDARDLVEILLAAVNHCHQHDVVHRDLKLENLLLVCDRDDNMIKLADFGLAAVATNETSLSGFCGTPGYVAPEILELQLYGKAVDMWSAGVIVFALLGGYLPFDAESLIKYRAACHEQVYFEPEFWAEVSVEAKDLICRLLTLDVKQRYTAAQALRHPWLKKSGSVLSRRPLSKTLSQIKVFNLHRKFKAIAHSLIAHAKFLRRLNFGRAQSVRQLVEAEETAAAVAAMNAKLNNEVTNGIHASPAPSPVPSISPEPSTIKDSLILDVAPARYDSKYGDLGVKFLATDTTPNPSPTAADSSHRKKSVSFVSEAELAAARVAAALMQSGSALDCIGALVDDESPHANNPVFENVRATDVTNNGHFSPQLPPRPVAAHGTPLVCSAAHVHVAVDREEHSPAARASPLLPCTSQSLTSTPVLVETVVTASADPDHVFKKMYQIQSHLGKGGFGHVFKANRRDCVDDIVAVKVLERMSLTPHEEFRIREESVILQSLKHPNIIEFYDFFEETKVFVIIMEYLDGGELFHRISKKLYYNEENARNVVRELLHAIKHCHDSDIVHRDIKAENIVMTSKHDDEKIKLIDFGLAGRVGNGSGVDSGCAAALEGYAGTVGYIAPEIIEMQPYGKAVDMWSIGVITYILLGGYMPFDVRDKVKCRNSARKGVFEFPDDYWADVSGDAKNFISKLLTVDASRRLTVDQALSHDWVSVFRLSLINL
jgi:serine/threonine protein kinase